MRRASHLGLIQYHIGIPNVLDGGLVCEGSKHVPTGSVHVIKSGDKDRIIFRKHVQYLSSLAAMIALSLE